MLVPDGESDSEYATIEDDAEDVPAEERCIWPGCTRRRVPGRAMGSGRQKEYCLKADRQETGGGPVHNARNRWARQRRDSAATASTPGNTDGARGADGETGGIVRDEWPVRDAKQRAGELLEQARRQHAVAVAAFTAERDLFARIAEQFRVIADPAARDLEITAISLKAGRDISAAGEEVARAQRGQLTAERERDEALRQAAEADAAAEQFAEDTEAAERALAERTAEFERALAGQAADFERVLGERSTAFDEALAERDSESERVLGERTAAFERALAERDAEFQRALAERTAEFERVREELLRRVRDAEDGAERARAEAGSERAAAESARAATEEAKAVAARQTADATARADAAVARTDEAIRAADLRVREADERADARAGLAARQAADAVSAAEREIARARAEAAGQVAVAHAESGNARAQAEEAFAAAEAAQARQRDEIGQLREEMTRLRTEREAEISRLTAAHAEAISAERARAKRAEDQLDALRA